MRFRIRSSLTLGTAAICMGAAWGAWSLSHRLPAARDLLVVLPSGEKQTWRPVRVRWSYSEAHEYAQHFFDHGDRLIYGTNSEAGCLDKSSGKLIWKHPLADDLTKFQAATGSQERTWSISTDSLCVYATDVDLNPGSSPPVSRPHQLCAIDAATGKLRWTQTLTAPGRQAPANAGSLLLLPGVNGYVQAFNRSDGKLLWKQTVTAIKWSGQGNYYNIQLETNDRVAVMQIGPGRIVAQRLRDGAILWSYPKEAAGAREAKDGSSEGFVLRDGIVYALLNDGDLVALDAETGARKWARTSGGSSNHSGPAFFVGDSLVVKTSESIVGIDPRTGATRWFRDSERLNDVIVPWNSMGWPHPFLASQHRGELIFAVVAGKPFVNGHPRALRSVESVDTLIAIDPDTGRGLWRAQPEEGFRLLSLIVDRNRFYVATGDRIIALEQGLPDPLPTGERDRNELAEQMTRHLLDWPPKKETTGSRVVSWLPPMIRSLFQSDEKKPSMDDEEAKLRLIRLGRSSLPALTAFLKDWVNHDPTNPTAPTNSNIPRDKLGIALDLIFDICEPSLPPALAKELDRSTNPETRRQLALTLIRFGDTRALPALFRYATNATDDPDARLDSLYFICRGAFGRPSPDVESLKQLVTTYLETSLTDKRSPEWLRSFAKLELMNDRGEQAFKAALASFRTSPYARLMPDHLVFILSKEGYLFDEKDRTHGFKPGAIARDSNGAWWAAFNFDHFGSNDDLWFAQSHDRTRWVQPVFGLDVLSKCRHGGYPRRIGLTVRAGRLILDWTEEITDYRTQKSQTVQHRNSILQSELSRDSDGDGIPDPIERAIGTNPFVADTNGNGIPDGIDKNPLFRPHTLTDEEGIYQAVVESLCQTGTRDRMQNGAGHYLQIPFGRGTAPLVVPLPPNSKGLRLLGYGGVVLPTRASDEWMKTVEGSQRLAIAGGVFTPPIIGFDGRTREIRGTLYGFSDKPMDPFAELTFEPDHSVPTFRTAFPYELSPDKQRARVGWSTGEIGFEPSITADIEVRKVGGQWVPVQCRLVNASGRWRFQQKPVIPVLRE